MSRHPDPVLTVTAPFPASLHDDGELALPHVLAPIAGEVPEQLLSVVVSATDSLEIAAALETCGMSDRFIRERLGRGDVFSVAEELYGHATLRPAPATDPRMTRPGNLSDLARGLMFAAPTLMFTGAVLALHGRLEWWSFPLALVTGWALSQLVAYAGFSRRGRGEPAGPVVAWSLLASVLVTTGLGLAALSLVGGGIAALSVATGVSCYMVACAALVVHDEQRLLVLALLPGALAAVIVITGEPFALPAAMAGVLTGLSAAVTIAAALRYVPARWWRHGPVAATDVAGPASYVAHGALCGLFVAVVVMLGPASAAGDGLPGVAAYPMILTLGVMEWQLRTVRSLGRRALLDSRGLAEFSRRARWTLARSSLAYLFVLAVATGAVWAAAAAAGTPVLLTLAIAATALSMSFFLALVVATCGRMGLVLLSWCAGLFTYLGWLLASARTGTGQSLATARLASCVAALVSLVFLTVAAARAIANPSCHA